MSRKKLQRFEANELAPNIIQAGKPEYLTCAGNWHGLFGNTHPIILELACGRGEYTVGLAQQYPQQNYVGVDIKGSRIFRGSQDALELGLSNAMFLRCYIQNLAQFFIPGEVAGLWLINPDPRPKPIDERRRLSCPRMLALYQQLLQPRAILHHKTDDDGLHAYTMTVLQQIGATIVAETTDLYSSHLAELHHGIKTKYELLFQAKGRTIKYVQFMLPANPIDSSLLLGI